MSFDNDIRAKFRNLLPVPVANWAGIGAVRYIPDHLLGKLANIDAHLRAAKEITSSTAADDSSLLTLEESSLAGGDDGVESTSTKSSAAIDSVMERDIKEIVELNEQLVACLQAEDGAFSLGEALDGLVALKFGMVNEVAAVLKLASHVHECGKRIEESSRVNNIYLHT